MFTEHSPCPWGYPEHYRDGLRLHPQSEDPAPVNLRVSPLICRNLGASSCISFKPQTILTLLYTQLCVTEEKTVGSSTILGPWITLKFLTLPLETKQLPARLLHRRYETQTVREPTSRAPAGLGPTPPPLPSVALTCSPTGPSGTKCTGCSFSKFRVLGSAPFLINSRTASNCVTRY